MQEEERQVVEFLRMLFLRLGVAPSVGFSFGTWGELLGIIYLYLKRRIFYSNAAQFDGGNLSRHLPIIFVCFWCLSHPLIFPRWHIGPCCSFWALKTKKIHIIVFYKEEKTTSYKTKDKLCSMSINIYILIGFGFLCCVHQLGVWSGTEDWRRDPHPRRDDEIVGRLPTSKSGAGSGQNAPNIQRANERLHDRIAVEKTWFDQGVVHSFQVLLHLSSSCIIYYFLLPPQMAEKRVVT